MISDLTLHCSFFQTRLIKVKHSITQRHDINVSLTLDSAIQCQHIQLQYSLSKALISVTTWSMLLMHVTNVTYVINLSHLLSLFTLNPKSGTSTFKIKVYRVRHYRGRVSNLNQPEARKQSFLDSDWSKFETLTR